MRRTAVINQLRGLLLERGINLRNGRCHVGAALRGILEDADARLSFVSRVLLAKTKPANSFRTVRFLRSASSSESESRWSARRDCQRNTTRASKTNGRQNH